MAIKQCKPHTELTVAAIQELAIYHNTPKPVAEYLWSCGLSFDEMTVLAKISYQAELENLK